MRTKRLYLDARLETGQTHSLDAETAHYLGRVLRARVGDTIEVFDGQGNSATGELVSLGRRDAVIQVGAACATPPPSPLRTTLLQGLSRSHKIDLVIQKAVELGVDEIVPVATERSAMRLDEWQAQSKSEHWKRVAIAACQQSGRSSLPCIHAPSALEAALENAQADRRFVALPDAATGLGEVISGDAPASAAVMIGPEGGLSEREAECARSAGWQAVAMGPRILRTETAAIALLSVLQFGWGDLG